MLYSILKNKRANLLYTVLFQANLKRAIQPGIMSLKLHQNNFWLWVNSIKYFTTVKENYNTGLAFIYITFLFYQVVKNIDTYGKKVCNWENTFILLPIGKSEEHFLD